MSALAFLGGLSQAAGDEYAKISDQKRLLQNQNNQALADTIHQRLETDNTLDWPTYSSLRQQEYKLRGVPTGDGQTLLQHEKSVWDQAQQQKNAQSGSTTTTTPGIPGISGVTLPPVPGYQGPPVTTGELRTHAQVQNINALTEAQIQKQREQLGLINGAGGGAAPDTTPGAVEEPSTVHYKTSQGIGASGGLEFKREPEPPKYQPSPVSGEDVLKEFPNSGADPNSWYRRASYSGDGSTRFHLTQPPTTTKVVYLADQGQWGEVKLDPKNRIVGQPILGVAAPAGYIGRTTSAVQDQYKIDPNTNELIKVQVGSQRTTTPVPPGQDGAGPTGPLPTLNTAPTAVPQAPVAGAGRPAVPVGKFTPGAVVALPKQGDAFNPANVIDYKAYLTGIDTKMGDTIKLPKGNNYTKAFANRMAELGIIPNEVDAAERSRSLMANSLLPHIDEVEALIQQAKAEGQYGTIRTRWNDFLTGKVGQDPTKNKLFSKLATNLAFLGSATAMVHGGLRGGSSPGMIEHWDQAIKAPDPDTALSELGVVKQWMEQYRNMARSRTANTIGGGTVGPSGPTGQVPPNKQQILDSIFKVGH